MCTPKIVEGACDLESQSPLEDYVGSRVSAATRPLRDLHEPFGSPASFATDRVTSNAREIGNTSSLLSIYCA